MIKRLHSFSTADKIIASAVFFIFLVVALSVRVTLAGIIDIDDVRLYSEITQISNGNYDIFFKVQVPIIQDALYIFYSNIFGWDAPLLMLPVFFTLLLAGLIGYLTFRMTSSYSTSLFSILFFYSFNVVTNQSLTAVLYPLAIFFSYFGMYLIWKYLFEKKSLKYAVFGGGFLVSSIYTHQIGLIFMVMPFVLWITSSNRSWKSLLLIYFSILLIAFPWITNHIDPVSHVLSFERDRWMVQNNYIDIINKEFWGYHTTKINANYKEFVAGILRILENSVGDNWAVISILSLIGIYTSKKRELIITSSALFIVLLIAITIITPASFGRYFYPILPLLSIGSALFVSLLLQYIRPYPLKTILTCAIIIILLCNMLFSFFVIDYKVQQTVTSKKFDELRDISQIIDDKKGIIGSRPSLLIVTCPENSIYSHDYVSEEDFVLFLRWPSDPEVKSLLEKYNIRWIVLNKPIEKYERDYHGAWLKKVYNVEPDHYIKLQKSEVATKVFEGNYYILYKIETEMNKNE